MTFCSEFIGDKRSLEWVFDFWPVIVTALVAGIIATFICKRIALKFGITDNPDDSVKTHSKPVAYLGGVGILVGFIAGIIAGIIHLKANSEPTDSIRWLLGIAVGAIIACVVGLIDDLRDIKPWQKIAGQLIAAFTIILSGIMPYLSYFTEKTIGWTMPAALEATLGVGVVIIFVLGATNSLNLLDGLDGLCAGVTAIIAVAMLLLGIHLSTWGFSATGDPVRIIVCLGLVGGIFGFLPFNRHPAKIFMGDAGSLLLGFIIAALMILYAEQIPRWWMASIVVFGLPILDTATALVRRKLNNRPLMTSDRGHIYDQMIDRGLGLKKTVIICYLLAGIYALIGLLMSQISTKYALVVYIAVFVVSAWLVWKKGFLEMEGLRGAKKKANKP